MPNNSYIISWVKSVEEVKLHGSPHRLLRRPPRRRRNDRKIRPIFPLQVHVVSLLLPFLPFVLSTFPSVSVLIWQQALPTLTAFVAPLYITTTSPRALKWLLSEYHTCLRTWNIAKTFISCFYNRIDPVFHAVNLARGIFNVGYLNQEWSDIQLTFFASGLKSHRREYSPSQTISMMTWCWT